MSFNLYDFIISILIATLLEHGNAQLDIEQMKRCLLIYMTSLFQLSKENIKPNFDLRFLSTLSGSVSDKTKSVMTLIKFILKAAQSSELIIACMVEFANMKDQLSYLYPAKLGFLETHPRVIIINYAKKQLLKLIGNDPKQCTPDARQLIETQVDGYQKYVAQLDAIIKSRPVNLIKEL